MKCEKLELGQIEENDRIWFIRKFIEKVVVEKENAKVIRKIVKII